MIDRMNESVLATAASKYGLTRENWKDLEGNVNVVYACAQPPCVLRFTHESRRDLQDLLAEADFVQYLAGQGVPVAGVIPALDGSLAVEVGNGYCAVVFQQAHGRLLPFEEWNDDFYFNWGKLLGQLHAKSRSYDSHLPRQRKAWYEDDLMQVDKSIPADETVVLQKADALFQELHRLPAPPDAYGLVHNDLHARNFLVQDGTLTAIDFDDSCYNWFISDLANIVYYAVGRQSRPPGRWAGEAEFLANFLQHFRAGYQTEHQLDEFWWSYMPHFLKLRRIALYVYYHQELDFEQVSAGMLEVIKQTRRDIEEDFPITSYVF
jgi:Ser/Thr protein kinase RdoA (MazF antagonist)